MSLDAIGIVSQDLNRSIEFYAILGVQLLEVGGPDHFEGATPSGVRIMLDSVRLIKELSPTWTKPSGIAVVLCFKQDSPAGVDEMFKSVTSNGFKTLKEPWDAFWGQRYASVLDPDGNQIDLFAQIT